MALRAAVLVLLGLACLTQGQVPAEPRSLLGEEPVEAVEAEGEATVEGEGEGEGEEEENKGDKHVALTLLGGMGFLMMIYYMVNSHIKGVAQSTWNVISDAVSIFVAVMTYNMVNSMISSSTKVVDGEKHKLKENPLMSQIGPLVLMLFVWSAVVALKLWMMSESKLRIKAYGTLGGHILGFAAIAVYGNLALTESFTGGMEKKVEGGFWYILVVLLIYIVTIQFFVQPLKVFFNIVAKTGITKDSQCEECDDQATDTANDFFCMGLSFLIAMFCRSWVLGETAGIEIEGHREEGKTGWLVFLAVVFVLLAIVARAVTSKALKKGTTVRSIMEVVMLVLSMCAAWTILQSVTWYVKGRFDAAAGAHGDPVLAALGVALFVSVLFCLNTYVIGYLEQCGIVPQDFRKELKMEMKAVSLALGLAWEALFDICLEALGQYSEVVFPAMEEEKAEKRLTVIVTFILVLVVFPAWAVYILPHDEEMSKDGSYKNLPPYAAFCDCGDDEEESDYEYDEP